MERNVKVEVIALWETDGQLRPLRFRFTGEDHQLHSAGIDQVLSIRQVAYVGGGRPDLSVPRLCGGGGSGCWS